MKEISNTSVGKILKNFGKKIVPIIAAISILGSSLNANPTTINNSYQYNNVPAVTYQIPLQLQKSNQVNTAIMYKQYINDLKQLSEILSILTKDRAFYDISSSIELNLKNMDDLYTVDFLKNILKVLKGVSPYNSEKLLKNSGYIKWQEKEFKTKYAPYLEGMYMGKKIANTVLNNNLGVIKKIIKNKLMELHEAYKNGTDQRQIMKDIYAYLIAALQNVQNETLQLKIAGVIKPFNNYIDNKYNMPKNWAQTDGQTTIADIIKFVLEGDPAHGIHGIKYYYEKGVANDITVKNGTYTKRKFILSH